MQTNQGLRRCARYPGKANVLFCIVTSNQTEREAKAMKNEIMGLEYQIRNFL